MTRDPVCMMPITPSHAVAMSEFGGRSYYFCSEKCKDKFKGHPQTFLDKAPGMRLTVGVMGSAGAEADGEVIDRMHELGRSIAGHGLILITGACPGLPHICAEGAKEAGGTSVGISPALSLDEHVHKCRSRHACPAPAALL